MPRRSKGNENNSDKKEKPKKKGKFGPVETRSKVSRSWLPNNIECKQKIVTQSMRDTVGSKAHKGVKTGNIVANSINNNAKPLVKRSHNSTVVRKLDMGDEEGGYRPDINDEVLVTVNAVEDDFQSEISELDEPIECESGQPKAVKMTPKPQQSIDVSTFQEMVNNAVVEQLWLERLKDKKETSQGMTPRSKTVVGGNTENNLAILDKLMMVTTPKSVGKSPKGNNVLNSVVNNKSPSDTTIYAPAFARASVDLQSNNQGAQTTLVILPMGQINNLPIANFEQNESLANVTDYIDVVQKITQFLEQMRLEGDQRTAMAGGPVNF